MIRIKRFGHYKELFEKTQKHLLISSDILSILISIAVIQSFYGGGMWINAMQLVAWTNRTDRINCPQTATPKSRTRLNFFFFKWIGNCKSYQLFKRPHRSIDNVSPPWCRSWKNTMILNKPFFPGATCAPSGFTILCQTSVYLPPEDTELCTYVVVQRHHQRFKKISVNHVTLINHVDKPPKWELIRQNSFFVVN